MESKLAVVGDGEGLGPASKLGRDKTVEFHEVLAFLAGSDRFVQDGVAVVPQLPGKLPCSFDEACRKSTTGAPALAASRSAIPLRLSLR